MVKYNIIYMKYNNNEHHIVNIQYEFLYSD